MWEVINIYCAISRNVKMIRIISIFHNEAFKILLEHEIIFN